MRTTLDEILKIECGHVSVVATEDHHFCLKNEADERTPITRDSEFIAPPLAFCDIENFYRIFECLYEHLIFMGFRDVRDKDTDPPIVKIRISEEHKISHSEMTKWLNDFYKCTK